MKKGLLIISCLLMAACGDKGGGGNNSAQTPVTAASTPLNPSTTCIDGTTNCQTSTLNYYQYRQYGWMNYPRAYNWTTQYPNQMQLNFCGCPVGYTPTYHTAMGTGCVRTQYVPQSVFQIQLYRNALNGPLAWRLFNTPKRSNSHDYDDRQHDRHDHHDRDDEDRDDRRDFRFDMRITNPGAAFSNGSNTNCYAGVVQSCMLREGANACSQGGVCVPTRNGSPMGLCNRNQLQGQYPNQNQNYNQNQSNFNGGSISR